MTNAELLQTIDNCYRRMDSFLGSTLHEKCKETFYLCMKRLELDGLTVTDLRKLVDTEHKSV